MNRVHSLDFDSLEGRELLSRAHALVAHAARAHAATGAPLVLNGTLNVNMHAATSLTNLDGGTTISAPVSGTLAGLGQVRGVWYEGTDQFGDYAGPDTITLRGSQGGFTIAFSNASSGPAHRNGHRVYYQHAQHVVSGSGAYARAAESGSIDLNENPAHTSVASITLGS